MFRDFHPIHLSWICIHAKVQKRFIDGLAKVPSRGSSVDVLVKEYLDGIAMFAIFEVTKAYKNFPVPGTL